MSKRKQFADAERAMFFALRVININGGRLTRDEIVDYMKTRKVRAADAGLRMAFMKRYLIKEGDSFVLTGFALQDFTMTFENDIQREAEQAAAREKEGAVA